MVPESLDQKGFRYHNLDQEGDTELGHFETQDCCKGVEHMVEAGDLCKSIIINNYSPKWRWLVVDV